MENSSIAGLYKHYKGDLYIVFGEGVHTENSEDVVVYRSFMDPHGAFFVRPKTNFFQAVEVNGAQAPRFVKLSDEEALQEIGQLVDEALQAGQEESENSGDKPCEDCNEDCSCST